MAGRGQPFPPAGEVPPHTPFRYRRLPPRRTLSECLFFFRYILVPLRWDQEDHCLPIFGGGNAIPFSTPVPISYFAPPIPPPQLKMPKDLRPKPIIDGDCCGCPLCLHVSVCAGHFQAGGGGENRRKECWRFGCFFFFFLTHCSQVPYVCVPVCGG